MVKLEFIMSKSAINTNHLNICHERLGNLFQLMIFVGVVVYGREKRFNFEVQFYRQRRKFINGRSP